jgi:branched-chain amino acid transport system permease protein
MKWEAALDMPTYRSKWVHLPKELLLSILFVGVLGVFPIFANPYLLTVLTNILLAAYLGQGWNLLGGNVGLPSFGHAMFFGIGAYTSTLLNLKLGLTPWAGMFIGGFVAVLFAIPIGYLSFRYKIKGVFFAMLCLGFAEILRLICAHIKWIGAEQGILIPSRGNSFLQISFEARYPYYYIALLMVIISWVLVAIIDRSKLGAYFKAIRLNEMKADNLGLDIMQYKLFSLVLSAFLVALGGVFYACYILYISPDTTMNVMVSVEMLVVAMVGGSGTVSGPIVGAFVLGSLTEVTRTLFRGGYYSNLHVIIYGGILMLVALFSREGIMGWIERRFKQYHNVR